MRTVLKAPDKKVDQAWVESIVFAFAWARHRPESFTLGPMKLLVALRDGFVLDGDVEELTVELEARFPSIVERASA